MSICRNEDVKTCTIDNPFTLSRECWQDGKLVAQYDALLFWIKSVLNPNKSAWDDLPAERRFFGANIGPWKDGQIVGDLGALQGKPLVPHETIGPPKRAGFDQ